ncbi:MAG: tRNA (N6-threonylcarbamoyladenosine(37)-N6)-methyltransferase TrmO [Clostridia bacterium]|nr:tRNA (N6-threonylcarbamoyladenosine(37)-N6)-methyltransferase TrmO [Clostridia bacterium]
MDRLVVIADMRTPFDAKFGVPRQSGTEGIVGKVVFRKPYADPNALRGLEGYSHIWILWGFSEVEDKDFTPTVRPPRLGGNARMGVFATRSPYRPNPIGLSVVKLLRVVAQGEEISLEVEGVDMIDGTPVYDIKPYLPYADAIPQAVGGWSAPLADLSLKVAWDVPRPEGELASAVERLLAQDPRPHYIEDESREYGMDYDGYSVRFVVRDGTAHVVGCEPLNR